MKKIGTTWNDLKGELAEVYECEKCHTRTKYPNEHKCKEEQNDRSKEDNRNC